MNVAEIAGRLLQYTDHRTLAEANTAGVEYLQAALDAINGAAQLCYLHGPETLSCRFFGHNIEAPASATVTYDTAWHWASGGSASYAGRAITVTGDTIAYNRILSSDASDFTAERDAPAALTSVPVPTGNIVVSGAGSAEVNGVYSLMGEYNGKPYYSSIADSAWDISAISYNAAWVIYNNSSVFEYLGPPSGDEATPDLVNTWQVTEGQAPAPTVTAEMPAATGAAATIYHDAVALDAGITHILPEVVLDEEVPLRAAGTEADLYLETRYRWDYGERFRFPSISAKPPTPGRPVSYWIQTSVANVAAGQSQPSLYMRLSPFPDKAYTLRYRARVRPPKAIVSDLDAANNGAACTKEIPMPAGWDELFLLPVAKQAYAGSPFFTNQGVKEEFARGYQDALERLRETHPQTNRPVRFIPEV
jgi:hypothetical protein